MSGDLFEMPTGHTVRNRTKHHGNKAPRAELRHVAAPAGWTEQQRAQPASGGDLAALRKAFRLAAQHDGEAALNVLSKYNYSSLADVKKAQVSDVHFDLVMLDFQCVHATC